MSRLLDRRLLAALTRKEFIQVGRDPSSILIAFLMPLVLLFLNGYGLSLDAQHVPFGLVLEMQTPKTMSLAQAFMDTPYFRTTIFRDAQDAQAAVTDGGIKGFAVIRAQTVRNFAATSRDQPVQLVVDGVDANTAAIVEGYASGVIGLWAATADGASVRGLPVVLEPRIWFNPELRSADFIVPGLISLVMVLVGALLTALVVSREWERGTIESLIASPASILEIQLSKLTANFVLGIGAMIVSFAVAVLVFRVPFRGSILTFGSIGALFLVTALAQGLLISTIARNQFVAAQLTFVTTYMPALMLSGLVFDIASMPWPLRWLTMVLPARYFVSSLQTLFLAGDVWPVLLPNTLALAFFAFVFVLAAIARSRRTLDT